MFVYFSTVIQEQDGGGIYISDSTATIAGSTIFDNTVVNMNIKF